jgi:hypothetical protein
MLFSSCFTRSKPGGKAGQRIHGPWPGSASHATKVRVEPRWEDFEYTYISNQKNRFAYFGNGWTAEELIEDMGLTKYLKTSAALTSTEPVSKENNPTCNFEEMNV